MRKINAMEGPNTRSKHAKTIKLSHQKFAENLQKMQKMHLSSIQP